MKPIPCLKGYTYTIIQRMFLFFGVLVLVVVPEKKKRKTECFKRFFMAGHIFFSPDKGYTKFKKEVQERVTRIIRAFETSIDNFNVKIFLILSENN